MKILIIHNRYLQKGGEDTTVQNDYDLLSQNNNIVKILLFDNNSNRFGLLYKFFSYPFNFRSYFLVRKYIRDFKPDIVHIHNFFYTASPIIFWAIKSLNIPLIVTIQNFRLICPSTTLYYKGKIHTHEIYKKFSWRNCFNKVYRNSFALTFWLQFSNYIHRFLGTWSLPDKYIFASNFSMQIHKDSSFGIYKSKFELKYNFMFNNLTKGYTNRENYFLFVGRLTEEKGINTIIESLQLYDYKLYIIGDGPLENEMIDLAKKYSNVSYLGFKEKVEVLKYLSKAKALIFPSIWFEGMPLTILEAFSLGTPVIASNLGAMEEMIIDDINGRHFIPGNAYSLIEQIKYFETISSSRHAEISSSTQEDFSNRFSASLAYDSLISIYNSVINSKSDNTSI